MSAAERLEQLTLTEFVRLYEQEGPFELIDGIRIPLMPPVAIHVLITRWLFLEMAQFCKIHNLGEVFTEGPFVLLDRPNWVKGSRIPDILFFSRERWQQYIAEMTDWLHKPFVLVPDLVVEVVSQTDVFTDVQDKVNRYLQDGVRLVWVIDPAKKQVTAYQGDRFMTLGGEDVLTGGEVLPGFEVKLPALFAVV